MDSTVYSLLWRKDPPTRNEESTSRSLSLKPDVSFSLELVRQGLSPYYTKHGLSKKYDQGFRESERYARKHKLNIWGNPGLTQRYLRLKSEWGQYKTKASSLINVQNKEWKYVAIRKSKVFYRPDCKWAKKIILRISLGLRVEKKRLQAGGERVRCVSLEFLSYSGNNRCSKYQRTFLF